MTRATIATDLGDIEIELFDEAAPKATPELHRPRQQGLLRRRHLPPGHPGLRHPGRRRAVRQEVGPAAGRVGTGGPGYKFEDEKVQGEYVRGALAMANSGPNTNGSQFFICTDDLTGKLPKNYTLFGIVTKGLDVVDKIVSAPRDGRDLPDEPGRDDHPSTIHPAEG